MNNSETTYGKKYYSLNQNVINDISINNLKKLGVGKYELDIEQEHEKHTKSLQKLFQKNHKLVQLDSGTSRACNANLETISALTKQKNTQLLPIPYEMQKTFIRYMLFYRITAIFCLISIVISLITVYESAKELQPYQDLLILSNNGLSMGILIALFFRFRHYLQHTKSKIVRSTYETEENSLWQITDFTDLLLILPQPTLWTHEINQFMHFAIMIRIFIPIKYIIYSSIYCDVRAYRLITTYGLNSKEHFFFAFKALIDSLGVFEIVVIEFLVLLFSTHCLYLVSNKGLYSMDFMDCFEVIIVTLSTVGFGEYDLPLTEQKLMMVLVLIMGSVLNSFITVSMLKELEMTSEQKVSYLLIRKIKAREHIQELSQNYIQKAFVDFRSNRRRTRTSVGNECERVMNMDINLSSRGLKSQYRNVKSLYMSISYTDLSNMFSYFGESLRQFRKTSRQFENMISLLLAVLIKRRNLNNQKTCKQPHQQSAGVWQQTGSYLIQDQMEQAKPTI